MKMIIKNNIILLCITLLLIATVSCEKNFLRLTEYDLPSDKAYVRFALFSPGTPAVMIKVNDVKLNGASTSGSSGLFPSVTNTPDYSAVTPNGTIRLSLPNTGTANDSVLIFTGAFSVEAGKFYSITLADTGIDRTVFSIQDNLGSLPDSGFFKIRLINAMPKTPPINFIRVDSTSPTVVTRDTLASNIAFKSGSDFITTAISPKTGYSFLRFRTVTNTGQLLASSTPPAASTLNRRTVTVYATGFVNGISTLAPGLSSFIYNQ